MQTLELLDRHPAEWREATRHPFLEAVGEGTFPAGAFEAWLVQDYLFVSDLLVFQARLLARTPRPAQAMVAGGLVAAEAELGWFEEKAAGRGLDLDAPRHPTTAVYRDFMTDLEGEPYPVAVTALWAIEQAYLEAWRGASPGHPDYREFVEHWTTEEFTEYVAGLQRAADAALETAGEGERKQAKAAFLEVVRLERDFWEMAWSGGRE
ncbi:MAG: TenA family transcriptional regulator [Actinomycetota bacterium]|nr:TenA family transcriptional regulator [Actinomycetota bacterium]